MYYPMMLELTDKKIVIIGGGKIAYRKAANFLSFEGNITVVSQVFIDDFENVKNNMCLIKDHYKESYLKDSFIVVAATDNKALNTQIGAYCKAHAILCNVVSSQELSSFIVPSCIKRGDLVISVSTGGKSPSLAGRIKRKLEKEYDTSYKEYVELLGEIREQFLKKNLSESEKTSILTRLTEMNLTELQEYIEKEKKDGFF